MHSFIYSLWDIDVATVGGICTDDVPGFPFIVRCRWRSSVRSSDDMRGYIVTVESQQDDVDPRTTESCPPLCDVITMAVRYFHKCLSVAGQSSCQRVSGLRAFVHVGCFSAADLLQG